jgi:hypothetical protein
MFMPKRKLDPIDVIDRWFATSCDGLWEHHHGLTIQTTDNPGWLLTFNAPIEDGAFLALSSEVGKHWGVELTYKRDKPEIYARILEPHPSKEIMIAKDKVMIYGSSLEKCVHAAAFVVASMQREKR